VNTSGRKLFFVSFHGPADQGIKDRHDSGAEKDRGNRMGEEGRIVPIGDDQGSAEMGFYERAEDDAHDDRSRRQVNLLHKIADDPEDYRNINFSNAIIGGISSGDGDDQDESQEFFKGNLQ
jgi:hypothetical protein